MEIAICFAQHNFDPSENPFALTALVRALLWHYIDAGLWQELTVDHFSEEELEAADNLPRELLLPFNLCHAIENCCSLMNQRPLYAPLLDNSIRQLRVLQKRSQTPLLPILGRKFASFDARAYEVANRTHDRVVILDR